MIVYVCVCVLVFFMKMQRIFCHLCSLFISLSIKWILFFLLCTNVCVFCDSLNYIVFNKIMFYALFTDVIQSFGLFAGLHKPWVQTVSFDEILFTQWVLFFLSLSSFLSFSFNVNDKCSHMLQTILWSFLNWHLNFRQMNSLQTMSMFFFYFVKFVFRMLCLCWNAHIKNRTLDFNKICMIWRSFRLF